MAIKVSIVRDPVSRYIDIFLWDERPDRSVAIFNPMELMATVYREDSPELYDAKPTLRIGWQYARSGILEAIAKALYDEGIKPEEESKMAGKLEAVNYHLEDLRTLLHLHERTMEAKK